MIVYIKPIVRILLGIVFVFPPGQAVYAGRDDDQSGRITGSHGNGISSTMGTNGRVGDTFSIPRRDDTHGITFNSALGSPLKTDHACEALRVNDVPQDEWLDASPELTAWFQRFVNAVDHAEEWVEVAGVLTEGKRYGYLDRVADWGDDQYTPLHYAAEEGDLEVVKALVQDYGFVVDSKTSTYKSTPLHPFRFKRECRSR